MKDLCGVLGVSPRATNEELRRALDTVRWTNGPNSVLAESAREAYSILGYALNMTPAPLCPLGLVGSTSDPDGRVSLHRHGSRHRPSL
jgi:hypothetical protein